MLLQDLLVMLKPLDLELVRQILMVVLLQELVLVKEMQLLGLLVMLRQLD
jgi:hypothetical protein